MLGLYLRWYFVEAPKGLVWGVRNTLVFGLEYFSVPLLLRTWFSPWKRYEWSAKGQGFSFKRYGEAIASNVFSRLIGGTLRTVVIAVGLATQAVLLLLGAVVITAWFLLPLGILGSFAYGAGLLF